MIAALLGLWRPLLAAFALGALSGGYVAHRFGNALADHQAVKQLEQQIKSRAVEATRREQFSATHEAERETVDQQTEEASNDLETYLQHHPDVRDLDLGPEWLCLIDRAAGAAAPRCASQLAQGLPAAGGAEGFQRTGGAPHADPHDSPIPHLPQPPASAGQSGEPNEGVEL